jgi:hypothetical protein
VFRRRTTDQVYATLQQVQRRITEGVAQPGQQPAYGVRPAAPPPARYPSPLPVAREPGTATFGNPTQGGGNPTPQPGTGSFTNAGLPPAPVSSIPPAPLQPPPPSGRFVLHIPLLLAVNMVLIWLLTVVVAFWFGQERGRGAATNASAPSSEKETAAPVAVEPTKRAPGWILVLKSVPTPTTAVRQQWQGWVDKHNELVAKGGNKAFKPCFDLREPGSGQLELVYGRLDGRLGIDKDAFEDIARILTSPQERGGWGFGAAKWVELK